jgi:nucleotide-binding universal stress UspA family protein/protein-tyrosine-phosphatase
MLETAILRALRPRHLLFLCVQNSARSQLAEGIARFLAPPGVTVSSAGSSPASVRPQAIRVLKEIGIDISGHRSKSVDEIDAASVEAVVTLCAEEVCPVFLGNALRLHWGLPDPAKAPGDDEARLNAFRAARDELFRRMKLMFEGGGSPREGRPEMFRSVLVASDLSAASDALIEGLTCLRPLGAEEVVLCHALGMHRLEMMHATLARFVEPRLRRQRERLETLGFKVAVEIAPGVPALEIHRVTREWGADLIAVGSRGASLAHEILLGGTATEVLHHARIPVLVVRLALQEDAGEVRCRPVVAGPIRSVLHPTDFSPASEPAFACVEELASRGVPRVCLLHVQDRPRVEFHVGRLVEEVTRTDAGRLEALRERLLGRVAVEVTTELVSGSPGREIAARAGRGDCDLVVMGSQGRGFVEEVFLGSASHFVARHAPLPVLLVPAPGR